MSSFRRSGYGEIPVNRVKALETQPVAAMLLRLHALPSDQNLRGLDDLLDAGGGVVVGHLMLDFDSAGDGVGDEGAAEGLEGLDVAFDLLSSLG